MSRSQRDPDAELQRVLVEHARDEEWQIRGHIADCPCCRAHARMIARLRVDLEQMRADLLDAIDGGGPSRRAA